MTVFLTTHYMEEASEADDVVIIDHGVIVAHDTPEQLRQKYSKDTLRVIPKDINNFIANIKKTYVIKNELVIIPVEDCFEALEILKKYENDILSYEVLRGNMDDVFVNITGRDIR